MPLSTFDGEPTEELHEHYDADGNPTGSTVVSVPGWTADDRAWALGLTLRDAAKCPGCDGDLTETLDYGFQWIPQPASVCYRCAGLQASAKANKDHPQHQAMLHTVRKVKRRTPRNRKRR